MAFQPIVDLARRDVFAYEGLVRGPKGEGAGAVLGRVPHADRYEFDRDCRHAAVATAVRLGVRAGLAVNVLPNAVSQAGTDLAATVEAAQQLGLPVPALIFELTEGERVGDLARVREAVEECRCHGARVAIDDFGAGYAGLGLLAELLPDLVKLDMGLVRGIDTNPVRRSIARAVMGACGEHGVEVIAEGVETAGELAALRDLGIRYVQGFLFARPAVGHLPDVCWGSVP